MGIIGRLTKGSRFYTLSPLVMAAAFFMSIRFEDPVPFITVVTTWMALAGAKSSIGTHKGNGA